MRIIGSTSIFRFKPGDKLQRIKPTNTHYGIDKSYMLGKNHCIRIISNENNNIFFDIIDLRTNEEFGFKDEFIGNYLLYWRDGWIKIN